jgi:hypothetical protein
MTIGLKLTLRFAAQKKLAMLKQFFVLIASLHLVFSTYPLRAIPSFHGMFYLYELFALSWLTCPEIGLHKKV